jgi:hypothetical protein
MKFVGTKTELAGELAKLRDMHRQAAKGASAVAKAKQEGIAEGLDSALYMITNWEAEAEPAGEPPSLGGYQPGPRAEGGE